MENRKYECKNNSKIPHFYPQIFVAWKQLPYSKPNSCKEKIINEYKLYNNEIKIRNEILDEKFMLET